MRRAYVVVGELEDGTVDTYYAICHSMRKADELCYEAELEADNLNLIFTWHEVIEEEDE